MTTISTQAAAAREGARHQDGKFGTQVREDNDIELAPAGSPDIETHMDSVRDMMGEHRELISLQSLPELTPEQVAEINSGKVQSVRDEVEGGHRENRDLSIKAIAGFVAGEDSEGFASRIDAVYPYPTVDYGGLRGMSAFQARVHKTKGVDCPEKRAQIERLRDSRRGLSLRGRNKAAGGRFFDKGAMRSFNSRPEKESWPAPDRAVFVDRVNFGDGDIFKVREIGFDPTLDHAAPEKSYHLDHGQYNTLAEAREAKRALVADIKKEVR